jgi:hypothetical protein
MTAIDLDVMGLVNGHPIQASNCLYLKMLLIAVNDLFFVGQEAKLAKNRP